MLSGNMGKDYIKWLVCVKITFSFSQNDEVLFACNSFCLIFSCQDVNDMKSARLHHWWQCDNIERKQRRF